MKSKDEVGKARLPFGQVPLGIFTDTRLKLGERLLGGYLWTYAHARRDYFVWPSQTRMARDLGVTERSILYWLGNLEKYGWLKKYKRKDREETWEGHPAACIYELVEESSVDDDEATFTVHDPECTFTHDPERAFTHTLNVRSPEHIKEHTTEHSVVVISELKAQGIKYSAIKESLNKHTDEYILEKLAAFQKGISKADNPAAFLVACLNEGWSKRPKRVVVENELVHANTEEGSRMRAEKYLGGEFGDFWD